MASEKFQDGFIAMGVENKKSSFAVRLLTRVIQSSKKDSTYKIDPQINNRALLTIMFSRVMMLLRSLRWRLFVRRCGRLWFIGRHVKLQHTQYISIGESVTLKDHVTIDALSRDGVTLGRNVSVGAFTIISTIGTLQKLGKGFSIGDNSNLGDYCFVGAGGGVNIGNNVLIGQRVSFHSENHNFDDPSIPIKQQGTTQKGIVIEDDCWLGSGAIFVDGVRVHTGAIVAAGSVVTEDVPAYAIVAGVPAKVRRFRNQSETTDA